MSEIFIKPCFYLEADPTRQQNSASFCVCSQVLLALSGR